MNSFSDFKYKSGSDFRTPWTPKFPTDAEIVMHLFLTVVDKGFDTQSIKTKFFKSYDDYDFGDCETSDLYIVRETGKSFAPYYSVRY